MASTIKVDNVQNTPGTNIVSKCGTDVTLGASGDTVALASGASQTGFGRTGTVDWVTTPQTGTVTAATGKGYFVNTTSGEITVNLPAGAAGSIVGISDYASTAASNNILVEANGAELINADAGTYTISTAGLAVTLVYVDGTRGWKSVTGSDADATGLTASYIAATGGNQPTASGCIVCTNYKVHRFTGPGTFCVSAGSGPLALADYLVVAGGGGGAYNFGGGGGGGGYRESPGTASGCYTVSPLGAAPAVALPITVQGYPITVGGGGAGFPNASCPGNGTVGSDSIFSSITSTGGGYGGKNGPSIPGGDGGSGGGGGSFGAPINPGGSGNTPSVTPAQGFGGGAGSSGPPDPGFQGGGGGGGATVVGTARTTAPGAANGGTGATTCITASPVAYAGGGAAGGNGASLVRGTSPCGTGGTGAAGPSTSTGNAVGTVGTINTGGGGGGGAPNDGGRAGGSGVVVIRYKFQ